jgi:hypothetical protein
LHVLLQYGLLFARSFGARACLWLSYLYLLEAS